MPVSKAQMKATANYERKNYGKILLRVKIDRLDAIKAHATGRGESVNGFINRAITETMERDSKKAP